MTARPALVRAALVGVAVLIAAGAMWAVLQAVAATTGEHRVPLDAGTEALRLEVDQGDIGIRAGAGAGAIARERAFLVGVSRGAEVRDGVARLQWTCRLWTSCRVDVRARAPRGAAVEVVTGFGAVHIARPTGDLDITSRTGGIEGRALTARRARVVSRSGDVRLDFSTSPTEIDVDVSSGDVEVRVPAGDYRIEAETRAGRVSVVGLDPDPRAARSIVVATTAGDVLVSATP